MDSCISIVRLLQAMDEAHSQAPHILGLCHHYVHRILWSLQKPAYLLRLHQKVFCIDWRVVRTNDYSTNVYLNDIHNWLCKSVYFVLRYSISSWNILSHILVDKNDAWRVFLSYKLCAVVDPRHNYSDLWDTITTVHSYCAAHQNIR